jgi:hypothetical protein
VAFAVANVGKSKTVGIDMLMVPLAPVHRAHSMVMADG